MRDYQLTHSGILLVLLLGLMGCGSSPSQPQSSQFSILPSDPIPGIISEPTFDETKFVSPTIQSSVTQPGPLVAVLDTEFRITHEQLKNRVLGYSLFDDQFDITDGFAHGTAVAALVARDARSGTTSSVGVSDAANLWLIKVTNSDTATMSNIRSGLIEASKRGAHVANVSWSNGLEMLNNSDVRAAVERAGAPMAVVLAAGNSGVAVTNSVGELSQKFPITNEYSAAWVMVGGSQAPDNRGNPRHPSSNFPGRDTELQNRFILAPYEMITAGNSADDGYVISRGTSLSAPLISGMLAQVKADSPHLAMDDAIKILLDSADRSSQLYTERCAVGGGPPVNCGDYYLGRGVANLSNALSPLGELMVPLSTTVSGESVPLMESMAEWSPLFATSLTHDVLANMVSFDAFGRDFAVQRVAWRIQPQSAYKGQQRLLALAQPAAAEFLLEAPWPGHVRLNLDQTIGQAAHLSTQWHRTQVSAQVFQQQSGFYNPQSQTHNALDQWHGLHSPIARGYGFGIEQPLGDGFDLDLNLNVGRSESSDSLVPVEQRIFNSHMRIQLNPRVAMTTSYWWHTERGSLLGSRGQGAFVMPQHNGLHEWGFAVHWQPSTDFNVYASHHWGLLPDTQAQGLITGIENIRTERWHIGTRYQTDRQLVQLDWSQPLAISSGSLQLAVPVGRSLSGEVMRDIRTLTLAPSSPAHEFSVTYQRTMNAQRALGAFAYLRPAVDTPQWGWVTHLRQQF